MRILFLHNRYQLAGGEDMVVRSEVELLDRRGHSVRLVEANNDGIVGLPAKAAAAVSVFHSSYWKRRVDAELRSFQPNIVHAHNLFPTLSPSVLYACAEASVPVVQTLHNYRMFCPGASLFRADTPCHLCLGRRFAWPGVFHGCYRGSRVGTLAVALSFTAHHALGTFAEKVARYVALTRFSAEMFKACGLPASKISIKPNFVSPDPGPGDGSGDFVLFVGRLSPEKGVNTLLECWRHLRRRIPLKIIGAGPLENMCRRASLDDPSIECLGWKPTSEVCSYMGTACALVLPSICYETFSRAIAESFAKGTPVIASRLGAMAELIDHGRTGLHFEAGSAESLALQLEWMLANHRQWRQMRAEARREFEQHYSADSNYETLMQIYECAMASGVRRLAA